MAPKKAAPKKALDSTDGTAALSATPAPALRDKSAGDYEDDFESEVEDVDEEEEEEADEDGEENEDEEDDAEEEEEEEEEESEDDDDEDDEDDELVDPLVLKINRQGTTKWSVLKLPNDVKVGAFLKAVGTHAGYADYRDALVYYLPDGNDGARVPIANAKQFKTANDHFWNGSKPHLRLVVVNGAVDHDSLKHALPSPIVVAVSSPPTAMPTSLQQPTMSTPLSAMSRAGSSDGSVLSGTFRSDSDTIRQQIDEQGTAFHWTPMRNLGSGAYGQVVEALTDSGRLIAVKHLVIPSDAPACVASTSQAAEELLSEIRLLKRLRHRHIVEYYGCQTAVQENGSRVIDIFLEHCHGGSINALRHRFDKQSGRLSVVLVRNYVRQVLRGLEYLHRKGVVHRDIKGDNVLIGGNGEAKLADFGCSKQVSTSLAKTTDLSGDGTPAIPGVPCKTLVGTPLFMAPEVLKETNDGYSSSADVWSVGCLVIELFGHKPWKVQGATLFAIMYAVATQTTPPSGMPTDCVDPKLHQFLMACFERDPSKRPSCAKLLSFEWMTCLDSELGEPVWQGDAPRPESRSSAGVA